MRLQIYFTLPVIVELLHFIVELLHCKYKQIIGIIPNICALSTSEKCL